MPILLLMRVGRLSLGKAHRLSLTRITRSCALSHSKKLIELEAINLEDTHEDELWKNWTYGSFPLTNQSPQNKDGTVKEEEWVNPLSSVEAMDAGIRYDPLDPLWTKSVSDEMIQRSLTVLSSYIPSSRKERFKEVLQQRTDLVRFVFENPNNPNNVWATLRTFDSFAIQFIDVIFNPDAYYTTSFRRKEMNNALGSQKWMTIYQHDSTKDCLLSLKKQGYLIVATDVHECSLSLLDDHFQCLVTKDSSISIPKIAIVMGNEHSGISNEVRDIADCFVSLPMKGFAESFNISVATAIICTVLQSKGFLLPNLTTTLKDRIMFVWMLRSIKQSLKILRHHQVRIDGNAV